LQGNVEEKVLTRIACSKLMQQKITRWRQEHEDWEALAAFALSKNTGRRFKNKSHIESDSGLDVCLSAQNAVRQNKVSDKSAEQSFDGVENGEVLDSDTLDGKSRHASADKLDSSKSSGSKCVANTSRINEQVAEPSQKQVLSDSLCCPVSCPDVVVKQISLDDLSGELFLPPPDDVDSESAQVDVPFSGTKIAKGFFVVSSDEESCDGESEALVQTAVASDTDDDNDGTISRGVLRNSIKSSTMFAKSLSHHQHHKTDRVNKRRKTSGRQNWPQKPNEKKHSDNRGRSSRFNDQQFTKSRGSFPNVHGSQYPKKNEKYSQRNSKYVNQI